MSLGASLENLLYHTWHIFGFSERKSVQSWSIACVCVDTWLDAYLASYDISTPEGKLQHFKCLVWEGSTLLLSGNQRSSGYQISNSELNIVNRVSQRRKHVYFSYISCRCIILRQNTLLFGWGSKVIWDHQRSNSRKLVNIVISRQEAWILYILSMKVYYFEQECPAVLLDVKGHIR